MIHDFLPWLLVLKLIINVRKDGNFNLHGFIILGLKPLRWLWSRFFLLKSSKFRSNSSTFLLAELAYKHSLSVSMYVCLSPNLVTKTPPKWIDGLSWKFQLNPYSRLGGVVVTRFGDGHTEIRTGSVYRLAPLAKLHLLPN